METEKILCWVAIVVAGLFTLIFLLDAIIGFPFNRQIPVDILFILGGAFVLWQGLETLKELR